MIHDTLIWTKKGWKKADELVIGDVVISYNPLRNCTEYDEVSSIHMEYGTQNILGLKKNSMNLALTPDHPFILINTQYKFAERKTINDVFLKSFNETKTVLYNSPFEPYLFSKDLEDVAWSARVAASFGNSRYMPMEYVKEIWNVIDNICGFEAQHWIDVFIHWNVLLPRTYWSKAVVSLNRQVKEMVFHVGPRAGFGVKLTRNPKIAGSKSIIGISTLNAPQVRNINWYRDRIKDYTFNIKTKNGNFLGSKTSGTFLCPCDVT